MAFVIETPMLLGLTDWGFKTCDKRQVNYNAQTWLPLKPHFTPPVAYKKKSTLVNRSAQNGINGVH